MDELEVESDDGQTHEAMVSESARAAAAGRESALHGVMVGAGFLADAYDLFVIGLVLQVLRVEYGDVWVATYGAHITYSAILGALVGQLVFGPLADRYGRRPMFILTSVLTLLGAILSAGSVEAGSPSALAVQLIAYRFVLGCGVGGEYPLSASVSHEHAENSQKPAEHAVLAVFCLQGVGFLMCAAVVYTLVHLNLSLAFVWRASLFVGALPSALALLLRLSMLEETRDNHRSTLSGTELQLEQESDRKEYGPALIGTASSWFLLDVTFYGNALVQSVVMEASNAGSTLTDHVRNAVWNSLLALPGYVLSYFFGYRVGLVKLQIAGFIVLCLIYASLALSWRLIGRSVFLVLYGLSFLFSNFGPNCTCFVTAASVFPTRIRASCHGISAAVGKGGALFGVAALTALARHASATAVYITCSCAALSGAILTFALVPREPPPSSHSEYTTVEH